MQAKFLGSAVVAGAVLLSSTAPSRAVQCVGLPGPCQPTIQAAIDAAGLNDTVLIGPGTYREALEIPPARAGLTLQGSSGNPAQVVIHADANPAGNDGPGIRVLAGADGVTIQALTVRSADTQGIHSAAAGTRVLQVVVSSTGDDCVSLQGAGPRVEQSTLQGCGGDGVQVGSFSTGFQVPGAFLEALSIRGVGDDGVDAASHGAVLRSNDVSLTEDDCIKVYGDGVEMTGNQASACGGDGIVAPAGVVAPTTSDDVTLVSNTVAVTGRRCFGVHGDRASLQGNTATNCDEDGMFVAGGLARLSGNTVVMTDRDGMEVRGDAAVLTGNDVRHAQADGVDVDGNGAVVSDNTVSRTRYDGIDLDGDAGQILRNDVSGVIDNHELIDVDGADAVVDQNVVQSARKNGIDVEGASPSVTDNTVLDVIGEPRGSTICLGGPNDGDYTGTGPGTDSGDPPPECINFFRCLDSLCVGGPVEGAACATDVDCYDLGSSISCGGGTCLGGPVAGSACSVDEDCANLAIEVTGGRRAGEGTELLAGIVVVCGDQCQGGVVSGNLVDGVADGDGYEIRGGPGLRVEGNVARHTNDDGYEILGTGVEVVANLAEMNGNAQTSIGDNGFAIFGSGHLVDRNIARWNLEDGFHVCGPGHTLTGNFADANGEDGFDVNGDGHGITTPCTAGTCDGGPDDGMACNVDADCARTIVARESGGRFVQGICGVDGVCISGADVGQACASDFQCDSVTLPDDGLCGDYLRANQTATTAASGTLLLQNFARENLAVGFEVSEGATGTVIEGNAAADNLVSACDDGAGTSLVGNFFSDTVTPCRID